MNKHTLHATAQRVFQALPPCFKDAFYSHHDQDDPDDFLGELSLAWLEGRTPAQARSRARRFTEGGQGPRGKKISLEAVEAWMAGEEERGVDHGLNILLSMVKKRETGALGSGLDGIPTSTEEIARRRGVTRRRAQQLLKAQVESAKACGDLWVNHEIEEKPLVAGRLEGRVENPARKINQASVAGQHSIEEGWA
ncbi:MAG: hypothetical protein ACOYYI_01345 [Chloroflexota bacterium]